MDTNEKIAQMVKENSVLLFMKGTKAMPQCGFSSRVAGILNYLEVDYTDFNVLDDMEIREGIKAYSEWPTIPQLYVNGEFVGGSDIITEMMLSGEMDDFLKAQGITYNTEAADEIRKANA